MGFIFLLLLVIVPASIMSVALWLIMKKTKVEGAFLQIFLISIIVALVNYYPVVGKFFSLAVLFLLLYKWEGIKFWPKVKFWPDSLLVFVVGVIAYFVANRVPIMIMHLFKSSSR